MFSIIWFFFSLGVSLQQEAVEWLWLWYLPPVTQLCCSSPHHVLSAEQHVPLQALHGGHQLLRVTGFCFPKPFLWEPNKLETVELVPARIYFLSVSEHEHIFLVAMVWWTTEVSHLVDWNMFCALHNSSELNKHWWLETQWKNMC